MKIYIKYGILLCLVVLVVITVIVLLKPKSSKSILLKNDKSSKPLENNSIKNEKIEVIVDDKLIDSDDLFRIIEPLWWTVSIYDGEEQYLSDLKAFSNAQRYIFAIMWYQAEVNNGGHDQFYSNSTGIVWEDAMNGFKEIGLIENYNTIKESADRLGGFPSKDRDKRNDQLDKLEAGLGDLDDKFYELETKMQDSLLAYVRENRKDFYFKGMIEKPSGF
jgi:hypothetical protein